MGHSLVSKATVRLVMAIRGGRGMELLLDNTLDGVRGIIHSSTANSRQRRLTF